ncbi:MAG TPA: hypothetical protein VN515_00690 [Terriglobales bacterium]|nr:hypothetical protein [Terriglobales bacterium]
MRRGVISAALVILSLGATAWGQHLPGFLQRKNSDFRTYGKITAFHLNAPLATSPPLTDFSHFPLKNFSYPLYPTASSGEAGMVPGNTETGDPLVIPVEGGLYDHKEDATNPMEFEPIKADPVQLPKAPGGSALLVYSVLYTGDQLANCTGIVQVMELQKGQLILTDQISYDCRGGADAEWNQDKHQLTVRSAVYSLGDKPCCPSTYDHVVFKLDGEKIKTGEVVLNNQ